MKSNFPFAPPPGKNVPPGASEERLPPSRFMDEKISDESDTESNSDAALKPTGLNNPFWN